MREREREPRRRDSQLTKGLTVATKCPKPSSITVGGFPGYATTPSLPEVHRATSSICLAFSLCRQPSPITCECRVRTHTADGAWVRACAEGGDRRQQTSSDNKEQQQLLLAPSRPKKAGKPERALIGVIRAARLPTQITADPVPTARTPITGITKKGREVETFPGPHLVHLLRVHFLAIVGHPRNPGETRHGLHGLREGAQQLIQLLGFGDSFGLLPTPSSERQGNDDRDGDGGGGREGSKVSGMLGGILHSGRTCCCI